MITIDEAILRGENLVDANEGEIGKQDIDAINLGIEALKRIESNRKGLNTFGDELLPGETKE